MSTIVDTIVSNAYRAAAEFPTTVVEILVVADKGLPTIGMVHRIEARVNDTVGVGQVRLIQTSPEDLTPEFVRGSTRAAIIDVTNGEFWRNDEIARGLRNSLLSAAHVLSLHVEDLIY
ncbi:hypothetical protein [Burkholderia phage BCSR5]|nr:hypothetical protein [Burkholderia phage BCSR5]